MSIKLSRNISLQPHNTMAVPATANYCLAVESVAEAQQAIAFAKDKSLPMLVIGEGSNTVFVRDYSGVVLLNRLSGIELINDEEDEVVVRVAAGENWHRWVAHCVDQRWHGIENLALIPGLLGAAPIQNIGAYGVEIKDVLVSVDYLDLDTAEVHSLDNAQCEFTYRDSIFKQKLAGKIFITAVTLRLSKVFKAKLAYPALNDYFAGQTSPSSDAVFQAVCEIRRSKLPLPDEIPNTGSFFKNPVIAEKLFTELKKRYPNVVAFSHAGQVKVAAGWMIEQAGWKEKDLNGVTVHPKQALVVVNPERRPGETVLAYAEQIQINIEQLFGIKLEIEPRIY